MVNILVTGGYGFLGQAIFRQSLPKDFNLFRYPSTKYNLLHHELVYDLFQTNEYDVIIHCAAKTGGKKGLAIAGMIIGIVAVILTALLVMGIGKAQQAGGEFGDKFKEAMEQSAEQMKEDMNQAIDSVQQEAGH